MPSSLRPSPDEIRRLAEKLGPEIFRRLLAQGLSENEAAARFESALKELAARWSRVGDRERWLLLAVEGKAPKLPTRPRKEPEHD